MERPELMHRSPTGGLVYKSHFSGLAVKLGVPLDAIEAAADGDELRAFIEDREVEMIRLEGARIAVERAEAVRRMTAIRLNAATAMAVHGSRQSRTASPLKAQQILALKRQPPS